MHPPTHPPTPANAQALARQMPKVLLHEHLDGGLRVQTLFELLADRGLVSPAPDVAGLARWFDEHAFAHSLEQYLKGFDLTVAAMATTPALERVASRNYPAPVKLADIQRYIPMPHKHFEELLGWAYRVGMVRKRSKREGDKVVGEYPDQIIYNPDWREGK